MPAPDLSLNELAVCEPCRPKWDVGTDSWWPGDCGNCIARFRPRLCEHVCSWVVIDYAIPEDL